jgi:hypothetical protein
MEAACRLDFNDPADCRRGDSRDQHRVPCVGWTLTIPPTPVGGIRGVSDYVIDGKRRGSLGNGTTIGKSAEAKA